MTTTSHVFAMPANEDHLEDAVLIGTAETMQQATEAIQAAGYVVLAEDDCGCHDHYDADDAPRIYGYEPDGLGAYGITVAPQ